MKWLYRKPWHSFIFPFSLQHDIEDHPFSKIYTCLFIILGHFIFYNVFIGVIIMNISEATENYKVEQLQEREAVIKYKKEFMMMRQQNVSS